MNSIARSLTLACLLGGVVFAAQAPAPTPPRKEPDPGWVSLFNGKDLYIRDLSKR